MTRHALIPAVRCMERMLRYFDTLEPVPITTENVGPRRNALPISGDVVTFPASRPY